MVLIFKKYVLVGRVFKLIILVNLFVDYNSFLCGLSSCNWFIFSWLIFNWVRLVVGFGESLMVFVYLGFLVFVIFFIRIFVF